MPVNVIKIPDAEADELIGTEERWLKYKDAFPFPEPYPIQKTVIALIDYAIEKGIKNIILQSPVGTGKTVLCVSVAKMFESCYYLTPKIGLMNQVREDFPDFFQVKGRGNFRCINPGETDRRCDKARCTMDKDFKCDYKGQCPYYVQKNAAIRSNSVVSNPAYMNRVLLSEGTENIFEKRDIAVWDEAHNLEDHFISMEETFISDYDYKEINKILGRKRKHETIDMDIKNDDYSYIISEVVELYGIWKRAIVKVQPDKRVINHPIEELERYNRILSIGKRLQGVLSLFDVYYTEIGKVNSDGKETVIKRYDPSRFDSRNVSMSKEFGKKYNKMVFSPITVSSSMKHINNTADINLFVSATITDFDVFCKSIGIPTSPNETMGIFVDESPFDEEMRIIYHTPAGYMNRNKIDDTLPLMAEKIEGIIRQNHMEHRGIILPYTHKIRKYIYDYLNDKFPGRILTHGRSNDPLTVCPGCSYHVDGNSIPDEKGKITCLKCGVSFFKYERDSIINRFLEEKEKPYILVTTYMNEGYDLKDDMARFAIVCKVPYPNFGADNIRKRIIYEQDKYRENSTCDYKGEEESHMVDGKQVFYTKDICSNWGCDRCRGWSNMKTAGPLVQMTGRVVRNKDDWAVVYIMDSGFKRFVSSHKWLFPSYFRDAIRWFEK